MLICYIRRRERCLLAHYVLMSCLLMKMESIYFVSTKGSAGLITALQQQNDNRKCSIALVWHINQLLSEPGEHNGAGTETVCEGH